MPGPQFRDVGYQRRAGGADAPLCAHCVEYLRDTPPDAPVDRHARRPPHFGSSLVVLHDARRAFDEAEDLNRYVWREVARIPALGQEYANGLEQLGQRVVGVAKCLKQGVGDDVREALPKIACALLRFFGKLARKPDVSGDRLTIHTSHVSRLIGMCQAGSNYEAW